jgi:hypothetical protein
MPPAPYYVNDPDSPETSGARYFTICPVTVTTRGRTGTQRFTCSLALFRCLDHHARHGNRITRLTANGRSLAYTGLSALNTYLRAHRRISAFWRVSAYPTRGTKYQWEELAHFLGFTFEP